MSFTRAVRAVGAAAAAGALLFAAAPTASADQVRDDQWALSAFSADKIWSVATGKGVTVAVIDTGFKTAHPDLVGQFLKGKDFVDGDTSIEPDSSDDDPGHGTAMASVIAGHGHGAGNASGVKGLAPDAKILPIRDDGSKGEIFGPSIRYAVDHGADVINISRQFWSSGDMSKDIKEEQAAIKYALDHGVPVVAGAGNTGQTGTQNLAYPASEPGAVAVGAVDSEGKIWEDSNYGPPLMLAAPGVNIVTAGLDADGYDGGNGTSDATAYTSAALALLKQKFPDLTAGQLVNRLVKTAGLPASAKGTFLPDEHYGYGYIQPLAALTKDIPAGSKNGPLKIDELNAAIAKAGGSASSAPEASSGSASSDSDSDSDGMSTGLIIGIAAGVLIVLVIVVVLIARSRKNNGGGPPPPPGGGWGRGGQAPYPGQQHPNPYQQAPSAPGSYPQAPSQPPYGQQ
ncbi:S8 family serine peptidase [Streptomyces sp. SID8379]|uniref:S8 family serine peptidase n=1 Tax=unclassified Streptomyces TaxID=2593676 RepID=UPI00035CB97D|nr:MULTISPECIES: S8 family serine peptidase [unclassified Streptomyces]MYW69524.1 S8 family serine peptidase [Streptomyces sp. SID8379]